MNLNFVKLYFISLFVFFLIDMFWLGLVAKKFYATQIGHLMKTDINWSAAIIFYLIFIAGLVVFVLTPALAKNSYQTALTLGAFFGFITYATYDLTNLATLRDWPFLVTVVDLLWGTVLSASVSVVSFYLASKLT